MLRTLRLHYDTAIDAACAIIIGLAISGLPPAVPGRGDAVVIDTSASMMAGIRGDRPLDEAARLVVSDEALRGARLFTLGWDPVARKHTLRDAGKHPHASGNPIALAAELESSEAFMTADYSLVVTLGARGFRHVTLVTDNAFLEGRGVTIRLVESRPVRYCYPASSAWDETTGRSVVRFVTAGLTGPSALWRLSADGLMLRPRPEDYSIAKKDAGFELSFPEAGAWAVEWDGRYIPFKAPAAPQPIAGEGSLAASIGEALGMPGDIDASGKRGIVVREHGGAGRQGFLSVSRTSADPYVLPPRLTLGAVVAAGYDKRLDLALGPASFASPETATVFYLARISQAGVRRDSRQRPIKPIRIGEGYFYPAADADSALVVIPPIGEYAPSGGRVIVRSEPARTPRLLVAGLLALLYILKFAGSRFVKKQNNSSHPANFQ